MWRSKEKIPSQKLTQMRQKGIALFHSNKSKESFSLQISMWGHGPRSNLDIPDENHTKGL